MIGLALHEQIRDPSFLFLSKAMETRRHVNCEESDEVEGETKLISVVCCAIYDLFIFRNHSEN